MLSFIHNTNGFMYCIQSTLLEGYALTAASDEFTTGWKSVAGHFVHTGPLNSFALFTKMFERPGVEISVWLLRCEKRKRILKFKNELLVNGNMIDSSGKRNCESDR